LTAAARGRRMVMRVMPGVFGSERAVLLTWEKLNPG
jgi:hypothetical protein